MAISERKTRLLLEKETGARVESMSIDGRGHYVVVMCAPDGRRAKVHLSRTTPDDTRKRANAVSKIRKALREGW